MAFQAVNSASGTNGDSKPWWKDGIVYQIYPASFKDSNGDGWGDIPGIISKIDYIKDLGIDIIWLSPMYDSPQHDMGYDISDYESVYPRYGTMGDMEQLIKTCHSRDMKLILDLVINHTSDQHEWFKESRSSKNNPKRDWYIWRPAKEGADCTRLPPTNWRSYFEGSTWEWDDETQEYYLHLFAKQQPDLNWENEETRKAIYASAMEFWLEKGIDGFRIDTVNMYSKGTEFLDAPIRDESVFEQKASHMWCNGPKMHDFLREMYSLVFSKYDTMTVGELPSTPDPQKVLKYIGSGDKQLDMVFQFDIVKLGQGKNHKFETEAENLWKLSELKQIVSKWQTFIDGTDGWTTVFCENHDSPRSVSRYVSDAPEWRERSAKMLAMMMCALTGTLFLYQGQELGMINVPKDWPVEEYKDIESLNYYEDVTKKTNGDEKALKKAMDAMQALGRDSARYPMQWDDSAYAGFTKKKDGAWMRTHPSYKEGINAAAEEKQPSSVLNFWKKMIQLRKQYKELFVHGTFVGFDMENEKTFIFGKNDRSRKLVVVLNFTDREVCFKRPEEGMKWKLLVDNVDGVDGSEDALRGYEGRIYVVE